MTNILQQYYTDKFIAYYLGDDPEYIKELIRNKIAFYPVSTGSLGIAPPFSLDQIKNYFMFENITGEGGLFSEPEGREFFEILDMAHNYPAGNRNMSSAIAMYDTEGRIAGYLSRNRLINKEVGTDDSYNGFLDKLLVWLNELCLHHGWKHSEIIDEEGFIFLIGDKDGDGKRLKPSSEPPFLFNGLAYDKQFIRRLLKIFRFINDRTLQFNNHISRFFWLNTAYLDYFSTYISWNIKEDEGELVKWAKVNNLFRDIIYSKDILTALDIDATTISITYDDSLLSQENFPTRFHTSDYLPSNVDDSLYFRENLSTEDDFYNNVGLLGPSGLLPVSGSLGSYLSETSLFRDNRSSISNNLFDVVNYLANKDITIILRESGVFDRSSGSISLNTSYFPITRDNIKPLFQIEADEFDSLFMMTQSGVFSDAVTRINSNIYTDEYTEEINNQFDFPPIPFSYINNGEEYPFPDLDFTNYSTYSTTVSAIGRSEGINPLDICPQTRGYSQPFFGWYKGFRAPCFRFSSSFEYSEIEPNPTITSMLTETPFMGEGGAIIDQVPPNEAEKNVLYNGTYRYTRSQKGYYLIDSFGRILEPPNKGYVWYNPYASGTPIANFPIRASSSYSTEISENTYKFWNRLPTRDGGQPTAIRNLLDNHGTQIVVEYPREYKGLSHNITQEDVDNLNNMPFIINNQFSYIPSTGTKIMLDEVLQVAVDIEYDINGRVTTDIIQADRSSLYNNTGALRYHAPTIPTDGVVFDTVSQRLGYESLDKSVGIDYNAFNLGTGPVPSISDIYNDYGIYVFGGGYPGLYYGIGSLPEDNLNNYVNSANLNESYTNYGCTFIGITNYSNYRPNGLQAFLHPEQIAYRSMWDHYYPDTTSFAYNPFYNDDSQTKDTILQLSQQFMFTIIPAMIQTSGAMITNYIQSIYEDSNNYLGAPILNPREHENYIDEFHPENRTLRSFTGVTGFSEINITPINAMSVDYGEDIRIRFINGSGIQHTWNNEYGQTPYFDSIGGPATNTYGNFDSTPIGYASPTFATLRASVITAQTGGFYIGNIDTKFYGNRSIPSDVNKINKDYFNQFINQEDLVSVISNGAVKLVYGYINIDYYSKLDNAEYINYDYLYPIIQNNIVGPLAPRNPPTHYGPDLNHFFKDVGGHQISVIEAFENEMSIEIGKCLQNGDVYTLNLESLNTLVDTPIPDGKNAIFIALAPPEINYQLTDFIYNTIENTYEVFYLDFLYTHEYPVEYYYDNLGTLQMNKTGDTTIVEDRSSITSVGTATVTNLAQDCRKENNWTMPLTRRGYVPTVFKIADESNIDVGDWLMFNDAAEHASLDGHKPFMYLKPDNPVYTPYSMRDTLVNQFFTSVYYGNSGDAVYVWRIRNPDDINSF